MGLYENPHRSQYDPGSSLRTRRQGCTWTSGANGVNASTGGRVNVMPDDVLKRVEPNEETNPATPGWSLPDLQLALHRLGIDFDIRSGRGWVGVETALEADLYVVLQGDSDVFADKTCSGVFDGNHAIGVHPARPTPGRHRIDDPICTDARSEADDVLRRYAAKFNPSISYGVFTTPVPREESDVKPIPITTLIPTLIDTRPDTTIYDLDGTTIIKTVATPLDDRYSPYGCGLFRAIYVEEPFRRLGLVKPLSSKPVPAPDCSAAIVADRAKAFVAWKP